MVLKLPRIPWVQGFKPVVTAIGVKGGAELVAAIGQPLVLVGQVREGILEAIAGR
jgi:hypothetical protein